MKNRFAGFVDSSTVFYFNADLVSLPNGFSDPSNKQGADDNICFYDSYYKRFTHPYTSMPSTYYEYSPRYVLLNQDGNYGFPSIVNSDFVMTNAFTIDIVFTTPNTFPLVSRLLGNFLTGQDHFTLLLASSVLRFYLVSDASMHYRYLSLSTNTKYYITIIRSGLNTLSAYINNTPVTFTKFGNLERQLNNGNNFWLFSSGEDLQSYPCVDFKIHSIRISDKIRSAEEISFFHSFHP